NEFSARLPSVIVGLGCVAVTILIGRTILNSTAGLLGGLIQISTFAYWRDCRTAELDLYLTFFVSLAMLAFCRMYFGGSRRAGWVLLFWIGLGCGAASKSVVTIPPVLISCGLAMWLCRTKVSQSQQDGSRGEDTAGNSGGFWVWQAIGLLLFAILALGWNCSMIYLFPQKAPSLWQQEIRTVLFEAHSWRPTYFYLSRIFSWAFPMSIFVPAAFAVAFSSRFRAYRRQLLFLLVWMAVLILSYSIWPMGKKKIEYLQPMLPGFALLCGWVWQGLLNKQLGGEFNAGERILLGGHSLLVIAAGLAGIGFAVVDEQGRWIVALMGGGLVVLGLGGLALKNRPVTLLLWGTVLASLAGMIVNFTWFLPRMNSQVSPRIFAAEVGRHGGAASKVVIYEPGIAEQSQIERKAQGIPALNFYLGYKLGYVSSASELKAFLNREPSGLIIGLARYIENLELDDLGLRELYRQDISRTRADLTSKRLPRSWQEPVGRFLADRQRPAKYTLLVGKVD
ncbi:MAG: phospholipid carrier-dependent glycosyltransferase, partial [Phycisphaerae bacterium]|nr:phospholipid carrier-dependent glycosyltransferase [Phycisphaerae bacterium]